MKTTIGSHTIETTTEKDKTGYYIKTVITPGLMKLNGQPTKETTEIDRTCLYSQDMIHKDHVNRLTRYNS